MTAPGPRLPPPAHAAPLPPAVAGADGVRVRYGVPFAALPGQRPLELDLYLPPVAPQGTVSPVVVFVHGGGWRVGSRHAAGPAYAGWAPTPFERVAAAGIAVASVDHRLSGEAIWPTPLHDVKAAVRWLRARAPELGVDPGRIAAWGESAGGHLAALLGVTGGDAELEGEVGVTGPSSAVDAVVAWYAPSDLAAMPGDTGTDPADPTTREAMLLGHPPAAVPGLAAQASPVAHVSAASPPFLLLHGATDRLVPAVQSERFHRALLAAGVPADLRLYPDADHMWLGSPSAAEHALAHTIDVLGRRLGVAG